MSKKNDPILETDDEIRDESAEQEAAEVAPAKEAETGTPVSYAEEESGAAAVCRVYCGPSVRNVVRQYTVFTGKIPDVLKEFIRKHPAAGGLLVPVDKFAETRRKLEVKGTAETVLYNKVKSEL